MVVPYPISYPLPCLHGPGLSIVGMVAGPLLDLPWTRRDAPVTWYHSIAAAAMLPHRVRLLRPLNTRDGVSGLESCRLVVTWEETKGGGEGGSPPSTKASIRDNPRQLGPFERRVWGQNIQIDEARFPETVYVLPNSIRSMPLTRPGRWAFCRQK